MHAGERKLLNLLPFAPSSDSASGDNVDAEDDDQALSTGNSNATATSSMTAMVLLMVKAVVNFDNLVEVSVVTEEHMNTLIILIDSADADRLIGGNGKTAHSIRTILTAACKKYRANFSLDIRVRHIKPADK